jgi:AcrR family transcriptional regulator
MPTQAERTATTRQALIRAAERLFAAHGFAATTVDELAAAAGVAKGGFYHHYRSKESLFREVLEGLQGRLVLEVMQAAATTVSLQGLKLGCRAFLNACAKPAVRTIVLLDGPAVLGWETWRAIDGQYFGGLIRQGLGAAVADGTIPAGDVDAMVALLLGAVTEAAMVCARDRDPAAKVKTLMRELERLLDALARSGGAKR